MMPDPTQAMLLKPIATPREASGTLSLATVKLKTWPAEAVPNSNIHKPAKGIDPDVFIKRRAIAPAPSKDVAVSILTREPKRFER